MSENKKQTAQNPQAKSGASNPSSSDLKAKTASAAAAIPTGGSSREEEMSMLRMMVNILEDSVNTMLRIEKSLNERLGSIERRLTETEKRLSDRIGSIGVSGSEKLEETLGKAVNDMQKGMEIMVLQNMVEKVEGLAAQIRGEPLPEKKKPVEEKEQKITPRVQRREKEREREREDKGFRDRSRDKVEYREEEREPKKEEERLVRPSDLFRRDY